MIGVLIVTHGTVGSSLLEQAQIIAGKLDQVETIGVGPKDAPEEVQNQMHEAVKRLNMGKGLLVLTDMFGGTPSNLAISYLDESEGGVEVLSGVNLPMLLKLVTARTEDATLSDVAADLKAAGRKNIALAREILSLPTPPVKAKAQ